MTGPSKQDQAHASSAMSARSRRARIARAARRLYWRALPFCFPCDRHTLRGHRHADATFSALVSREWRA